jgi:hypothetical protein
LRATSESERPSELTRTDVEGYVQLRARKSAARRCSTSLHLRVCAIAAIGWCSALECISAAGLSGRAARADWTLAAAAASVDRRSRAGARLRHLAMAYYGLRASEIAALKLA